jgi:hypothetical protein
MRPAVRLTRSPEGGFRLDGVAERAIEALPRDAGFVIGGEPEWRLEWSAPERGWLLVETTSSRELGRTTTHEPSRAASPSSVLLSDGRLFRLALEGASDARFELGRWDLPGAYAVARAQDGGWSVTRTAAGESLESGPELWILVGAEIARLDGWW